MEKKKLYWINPLAHNVYTWWLWFFNKYFKLEVYDNNHWVKYGFVNQNLLKDWINIPIWKGNDFTLYQNYFWISKENFVILWDVFTNSLAWTMTWKNKIFYTEFFIPDNASWKKKLLFKILSYIWRNKKILLPTVKAYNLWKSVSKNILYFPQIYFWELFENTTLKDDKLKILFVWHLDDRKKNIRFMLDSLIELKNENIEIWLCGSNDWYSKTNPSAKIDIENYQKIFWDKFKYHGKISYDQIDNIYTQYNVFILPSLVDPIWSVVMEAMAHSLPVIVSENVWSSDYIKDWVNWFIFKSNDKTDLINKVRILLDKDKRTEFWENSKQLVMEKYWYKNDLLLEKIYENFSAFLKN